MRLKFFLAIVTGLALLSSTNVSSATCPIYYYDAHCVRRGLRSELLFTGVQLLLDQFEFKNKFTVKKWSQSCLGKSELNHGEDPPPPQLEPGSVFIAQEATKIMEAGVLKDLRYKYILKRSNSKGEFDVLLTGDEVQSHPDAALDSLFSKMKESTSCIAGRVYMNNEGEPPKSSTVTQKSTEPSGDGFNTVVKSRDCVAQAAAAAAEVTEKKGKIDIYKLVYQGCMTGGVGNTK